VHTSEKLKESVVRSYRSPTLWKNVKEIQYHGAFDGRSWMTLPVLISVVLMRKHTAFYERLSPLKTPLWIALRIQHHAAQTVLHRELKLLYGFKNGTRSHVKRLAHLRGSTSVAQSGGTCYQPLGKLLA
jgi:hypothetical protein